MGVAPLFVAALLALTPSHYVASQQRADGGFGDPTITAWAVLGLRAEREPVGSAPAYLAAHEQELASATEVELVVAAEAAVGAPSPSLLARLRGFARPGGGIGPSVNSTIWGVLALRQAGEPAPAASVRWLLKRQARSGGWSWFPGGQPDSNDTAAAIEALRSAGVAGAPIRRGVAYLRRLQNRDGGFELTPGRGSDVQSTAWAVQALVAAGGNPRVMSMSTDTSITTALRYLSRMRRPDGSLRYSARYAVTPLWVTAQALPALARKPFPLTR